ncbi:MAG: hypothetical protein WCK90_03925 [archaeon]
MVRSNKKKNRNLTGSYPARRYWNPKIILRILLLLIAFLFIFGFAYFTITSHVIENAASHSSQVSLHGNQSYLSGNVIVDISVKGENQESWISKLFKKFFT